MKFSFIIPVYNCGKYLDKFICEISDMKLWDYEIILIDDGSTDDSAAICDNIAEKNLNIVCIHQKNQGVSSARNSGLQVAKGDYICFFDADDDINSAKLCKLLKQIEKEESVIDIVFFGMSFDYYYHGKIYRRDELMTPLQGICDGNVWLHKVEGLFYANSISSICNKVFRRMFLLEHRLYFSDDIFIYEDLEFLLRCMAYCDNILFEPKVIYYYRQSEDEGNAGRRLMRIDSLSELVIRIENSATAFKTRLGTELQEISNILMSLYLVLAKEKIGVSNAKQIKQICDDFADWYQDRKIEIPSENQNYARLLLNRKVKQLILKREYIRIRHKTAVVLKNTRFYQKLRGNTKWI